MVIMTLEELRKAINDYGLFQKKVQPTDIIIHTGTGGADTFYERLEESRGLKRIYVKKSARFYRKYLKKSFRRLFYYTTKL